MPNRTVIENSAIQMQEAYRIIPLNTPRLDFSELGVRTSWDMGVIHVEAEPKPQPKTEPKPQFDREVTIPLPSFGHTYHQVHLWSPTGPITATFLATPSGSTIIEQGPYLGVEPFVEPKYLNELEQQMNHHCEPAHPTFHQVVWNFNTHYEAVCKQDWATHYLERGNLAPIIKDLLTVERGGSISEKATRIPACYKTLANELPHISTVDPKQIAYCRSPQHAEQQRVTRVAMGRYIRRHFTTLADHEIRDWVELYTVKDELHITDEMGQMIDVVQQGPGSCMQDDFYFSGEYEHPYEVYDPALGWKLAYTTDSEGRYTTRTLLFDGVLRNGKKAKCFVRSYGTTDSSGYCQRDTYVEAKLKDMGYEYTREWPSGTPIARLNYSGDRYVMPYIDGNNQGVDIPMSGGVAHIVSCGDVEATETCGYVYINTHVCECCDERVPEDNIRSAGAYGDDSVCESCVGYHYVYAYTAYGHQWYIHEDDCVVVDGEWYHINYLSDNEIGEDVNGDYAHNNDLVEVLNYGMVKDDELEEHGAVDLAEPYGDCWYALESECVEIDGDWFHEDSETAKQHLAKETEES